MKTLIKSFEKVLTDCKKGLAEKDKECYHDESVQDDTEWVNDYHNLQGWVEALKFAISETKRIDKKKKV